MRQHIVGEEADRLNRMVGDLLDYSRPVQPALQPVPLQPLFEEAIASARQQAGAGADAVAAIAEHPGMGLGEHALASGPYGETRRSHVIVTYDNFPENEGSTGANMIHKSLKRRKLLLVSFPKKLV